MKKKFLVILMIVAGLLIMLSGCSKSTENMQIIRTGGSSGYKSGMLGTIKSKDELDLFISKNSAKYNLAYDTSSYSDGTISFLKAVEKYDTEFFESKFLALYYKVDGTSSIKYKFDKSIIESDNLEIYISCITPSYMTTMFTYRIFIAEIHCDDNIKDIIFNFV